MTALILTEGCLARLRQMPSVSLSEWRYPMDATGKLVILFPPPNRHVYVVLLPSAPGTACGVVVVRGKRSRFTFDDGGGLVGKNNDPISDWNTIAVVGTSLLAVHELNEAQLTRERTNAPRQVRKAIAAAEGETGDDYWIITPRTGYIPEIGQECRETGIKQRYHMRRGHWRHYKDGRKVWVMACHAGDKSLGVIHKDYKM